MLDNLRHIIRTGTTDLDEKVRTRWQDGNPAYTLKTFGVLNSYDLSKEFPLSSLRPTAWKAGLKEMLWIYQDKSNDVNLLEEKYGVKYWESWANEEGNLGTSYGGQMNRTHKYPEGDFDQIDRLIFTLKHNPFDRRMITNMFNHEDLHSMTLPPCAFMTMWDCDGEYLNMTLVQRSSDYTLSGNINLTQYSLLLHMIAQVTGYKAGKINHYINNLHVYDRHLLPLLEILEREDQLKDLPKPKLEIDDSITDFYDFRVEHFKVTNYEPLPQIKFEVAI